MLKFIVDIGNNKNKSYPKLCALAVSQLSSGILSWLSCNVDNGTDMSQLHDTVANLMKALKAMEENTSKWTFSEDHFV